MILRIVRLHIEEEHVEKFIAFFNAHKNAIAASEGCHHLEMLADVNEKGHLMTYSIWASEAALDQYRRSDIFREIWPEAKKWFADKPIAQSYPYPEDDAPTKL